MRMPEPQQSTPPHRGRCKGKAGTGNIIGAVCHVRSVMGDIRMFMNMDDDKVLMSFWRTYFEWEYVAGPFSVRD